MREIEINETFEVGNGIEVLTTKHFDFEKSD
jgi:hypothetical protein